MGNVLLDLFQQANALSSDSFGVMVVFSIYAVVFLSIMVNKREFAPALISAGTITALATVFLRLAELVNDRTFFLAVTAAVVPILIILFMKKG